MGKGRGKGIRVGTWQTGRRRRSILTGRGGLFGRTFNNNYATMERMQQKKDNSKSKKKGITHSPKKKFTRKMSTHPFREATPRQQAQSPLRICRTVNCTNGWVVVWRREDRGLSGNMKRDRETTMTLHERRHCPRLGGVGHEEARWDTNGRKPSGPWPSEPGPGCEVCPPGQHFLTREVDAPVTARTGASGARGGAAQTTPVSGLRGKIPRPYSMCGINAPARRARGYLILP